MGDGADRPVQPADLDDFLPADYQPHCNVEEALRGLPSHLFPPNVIGALVDSFAEHEATTDGPKPADIRRPLTRDDKLVVFAYSYEQTVNPGGHQVPGMLSAIGCIL